MRISHYRRSGLLIGTAIGVLLLGFIAGWLIAQERAQERDTAVAEREQARSNEQVAREYLQSVCDAGIKSACHMLEGIERLPDVDDPEIQESEVQESEIQEPEIQEPDTFCRENVGICRGEQGRAGVNGKNGRDGVDGADGLDGQDGAQGPQGETGATGPQGEPGPPGEPGQDGADGAPGQSAYPFTFSFTVENNPAQSTTYTVTCSEPRSPCTVTAS